MRMDCYEQEWEDLAGEDDLQIQYIPMAGSRCMAWSLDPAGPSMETGGMRPSLARFPRQKRGFTKVLQMGRKVTFFFFGCFCGRLEGRKEIFSLIHAKQMWVNGKRRVRETFRHATLNFVFILLFIQVFQAVFGPENSIVGVIFTIMMSASMVRDLTAAPLKHLAIQAAVLVLMAATACFVVNAPPLLAFPVNLAMLFLVLYAFTYEYVSHLYFPYILSYLFLVFISPIQPEQLPKRMLGMLVGAVCIIAYQLINGRKRVVETARDVLIGMIDKADECIRCLLSGTGAPQNPDQLRADLCRLSKIVYDRRKRALCISDASFAMIDAGRGMENLVLLLYEMEGPVTPQREELLGQTALCLERFRRFLLGQADSITLPEEKAFGAEDSEEAQNLYLCMVFVRNHIVKMTWPEERNQYQKTVLSLSVRLKAALRVSPVRVIYALRVSCLLAFCTLLVQTLGLPHGRWLLFTVASVSLPYADDVEPKARKRMIATMVGGVCSVVLYGLIPSAMGRVLVMMLSGYLSFYFSDYAATFACSTVGALGGAVFTNAFGWESVGSMLLIRLTYISAGIILAMVFNCWILPFRRNTATRQLLQKYVSTTSLLERVCREEAGDLQLYYNLVIQAHLQESKLWENVSDLNWDDAKRVLVDCRRSVRLAHRHRSLEEKVARVRG